jgi:beta-lactamase class A
MRIGWAFLLAASYVAAQIPWLEREMARVAQISPDPVGAVAIHIETGRRAALNAEMTFSTASTMKIPIASELLRRVDAGEEKLARMITIGRDEYAPGSGTLRPLFRPPGDDQPAVALSVRMLLELMLLISDNTATDLLLREVGGAEAVNARMKALGIEGLHLRGGTKLLIEEMLANLAAFRKAPTNHSTPEAMSRLLVRIAKKQDLSPASADLLLDILKRCQTGDTRLKGILPKDTVVRHKTGSDGAVTADVGIIELPDGAGHVALSVFAKSESKDGTVEKRERAIAEIARTVHDFFLYQRGAQ